MSEWTDRANILKTKSNFINVLVKHIANIGTSSEQSEQWDEQAYLDGHFHHRYNEPRLDEERLTVRWFELVKEGSVIEMNLNRKRFNHEGSPNREHSFETKDRSKVDKGKTRPGKKRGPRSDGRYPFMAYANRYLGSCDLGDSSWVERERRLKRIHRDLLWLLEQGFISTVNPEKMSEDDIQAFVELIISRRCKGKNLEHELNALNQVLLYADNQVIRKWRAKHKGLVKKWRNSKRLPPLEDGDVIKILSRAEETSSRDWTKMESYAMVVLSIGAGGRHQELREGNMDDLAPNEGSGSFHVSHPKGEDTYGEERDAPLRKECIPFLNRYLDLRREMLVRSPTNELLFPALRKKKTGMFSDNSITKMVRWVGKDANVKGLTLQKCRRTYGQYLMDIGLPTDEVSRLMGHLFTHTTEKHYARKKASQAADHAQRLMSQLASQAVEPAETVLMSKPLREEWDPAYT